MQTIRDIHVSGIFSSIKIPQRTIDFNNWTVEARSASVELGCLSDYRILS